MRRLIRAMAGTSALTAAFVGGLTAAGQFRPTEPVVVQPQAVTGPDALVASADCDELLTWYLERHLPDVGPYGWDGPVTFYRSLDDSGTAGITQLDGRKALAPSEPGRTSSETGTNTQEVGVDEPDTAKTDGRLVVQAVGGRLVVTDVSSSFPRRLSEVSLPAYLGRPELLLVGDRALVVAEPFTGLDPDLVSRRWTTPVPAGTSRLVEVDLSDPAVPQVAETREYDGSIESVRQYGDVVRVVVEKPRPELAWVLPGGAVSEDEARARNQALVRATTIEDWLPSARDLEGRSSYTLDCADVHRPATEAGDGTVAVFTERVGSSGLTSVGVAAGAEVVYSSAERLLVATSSSRFDEWRVGNASRVLPRETRTQVHAFALDGEETAYLASGSVPGSVRDRWSFDEQDGDLRVAFARPGIHGGAADNAVVVLDEQLRPRGSVTGLGIDEDIQSVRWFDDFAVVVTFRQVDPLYTISFEVPDRPRLLGELKIPGFSAYLHPLGGGRLLGLGQDATLRGEQLGAQAAIFDIGTLTDPREVARHRFAAGTELLAGFDPRAFTWVPSSTGGAAYTLLRRGWWAGPAFEDARPVPPLYDGRLVPLALSVSGDRITATPLEHTVDERTRFLPLGDGRVVLAGPDVQILG